MILSGGGTAGHVYPALALAHSLQVDGHEILFVGTPDSIEERLVRDAGVAFESIDVRPLESDYTIWRGPDKAKYSTLITSPLSWVRARKPAGRIVDSFRPDVVIGFGGYVCAPIVWAAHRKSVPVVLHEQNSVMGKANRQLAKKASAIAHTYASTCDEAKDAFAAHSVVTGNPIRPSMRALSREVARSRQSLSDDDVFILVFGGSRGARTLNEAFASQASHHLCDENIRILHATGARDYEMVEAIYRAGLSSAGVRSHRAVSYIDNMDEVMPAADLVIARAGSTTIAEISALEIPAILVPFPHATGDHQTKNATPLVEVGAARLIRDDQLGTPLFIETICELIEEPNKRAAMRESASALETRNALRNLVQLVYAQVHTPGLR